MKLIFFLLPYSTGNCEVLNDPYGAANGSRDNVRKATGLVYDPLMAEHRNPWDPGMNLETKNYNFFFCVQWSTKHVSNCKGPKLLGWLMVQILNHHGLPIHITRPFYICSHMLASDTT